MNPRPDAPRKTDEAAAPQPPARPSGRLVGAVAVFVVGLAVVGYAQYGQFGASREAPAAAAAQGEDPQAQIAAMVIKLEERLKSQPEDAEGWTMLGRTYNFLGRYAEAVTAFKRVVALRPDDAQAYADQADAAAMAAGRQLAGEPEQLIARALQLDPKNLKALALAGTIAFDRGDFAGAIRHWEGAIAAGEPGSDLVRNLQAGVDEAKARAAGPAAAAAAPPPASTAAAAAAGQVSGRVVLAPALLAQAAPGDTLFVFARAANGRGMPLAILRKQVKDLPFDFVLDDTLAMSPAARLSGAAQVVVGARISKSGNAMAQPGDLQGASPPVPVGTRALQIEIADVVK